MKQLLFILFFLPSLLYSQSEGGFGFRRFANTANLTATSVNNSDKNASRRAYVHSTGLYYRWNGSAWSIEETIDTFSISSNVLSLSILNDGVPAKTVNLSSYLQTLSIDSGSITGKERFGITISGGNTVHFDVAKSIYTDNGATISGGTNVTVNSNTLNLTTNGFTQPVVRKKSNQSIGYFDRYVINNDSLDIYYISPLFGISAFGSDLGLSSTEKLQLTGDSVLISTIATTTALKFLTGTTSGNYLKRMVGTTDGDVVAWDGVSSHWEVRPKTDYNINIGNSDLTTDDNERTLTLLDDFNIIGDGSTPDFYVEMGSVAGGRLNIRDSSLIYNVDVGGTNKLTAGGSGVHISTGTSDQVTINTDKINLKDASGTVLDLELLDDTRMKVDSTNEFAIGRWPNFPDAFEYLEKNRYGLLISDNTSSGKKTTIAGMAYDRTSSSYITSDRGSYQFNTSNYLASGTAEMVTGATPPSFYNYNTHPLEPYDNIEMGFRNQWVGIPKDKTQYAYLYQGGDRTASAPFDTAAITMWIGIPQITDTTATAKSTLGTKAVSKVRGWGVQSLFHRTSTQQIEHPFNWIKISTGSVAADTLLNGIQFYNNKYQFINSTPSPTVGDTSIMGWVGTGSVTTPIWLLKSQFGGGSGTNIYNSNGTTTANTRTATILESIRFVGTADIGQQYPFQVHSTGNEPPIQLWKGNTDSVYLYQSDVEYHYGSSTVFQIESSEYLILSADSIQASTLSTKTKIQNIVGISNSGTLQQIEGTSGGQVLTWNASGYWELGSGGGGSSNYQTWKDDGVSATTQPIANFVSTSDIAFTLTNDAGNTETEVSADIPANAIDLSEIQTIATGSLLGRSTAGTGNVEVITVSTGLTISSGNITANDPSATNEGSLTVNAGSSTTSVIASNTSGSTDVTLTAAGILAISEVGNVITMTATEVDGSVTNELQTVSNTSDATSHTVTLSNSGGSFQLVEGSNITLTTSGTGSDGIITIAATGGGGGGDGIYGGSGTIPDNTDATIASTGDFRFLYSGGNPAFEFDDGLNQVYISGQNGTYSAYADNSNVGLVAGTGTWLVGSDYALTATASVANTNTQADRLVIQTNSSGTASTNFGSSILFQGESSTTDNRDMLTLGVGWSTVTDASRTAYLDVNPIISGTEVNMYRFGSTGLLVRNTSGSNTMTISSAGLQGTQSMTLGASGNSVTLGGSSGAVTIQSSSNTTTAIVLQPTNNTTGGISIGGVALTSTTLDKKEMRWGSTYTASSGSGVHTALAIQNTYNLTSTASGLQTSILIDPTFTSLTGTYRAIDITANNSSAKGIYQTGSSTVNNFVGPTGFGATTVPDDAIEVTGNLEFLTAGNKIKIATGSNASAGQSGAMTAGSITISTTAVTSNSLIFLNHASVGGTQGILSVGTITAGTSFVINSSSALDTSTVNWWIIN